MKSNKTIEELQYEIKRLSKVNTKLLAEHKSVDDENVILNKVINKKKKDLEHLKAANDALETDCDCKK